MLHNLEFMNKRIINNYTYDDTGCTGGVGRGSVIDGIGSGGGHGGKGGAGCYGNICIQGGISYGNKEMPCELGSGSGNDSSGGSTAGGGVIGELDCRKSARVSFYIFFSACF